jgi:hypothetical protein
LLYSLKVGFKKPLGLFGGCQNFGKRFLLASELSGALREGRKSALNFALRPL